MSKKVPLGITIALVLVSIAATFAITMMSSMKIYNKLIKDLPGRTSMYSSLSELDKKVRQNFKGTINEKKLSESIAKGYVEGLGDPHSQYLTAGEYKTYSQSVEGKMAGIGVLSSQNPDDKNIYITEVFDDSPAKTAGIQKGDEITAVNDKKVTDIGYESAMAAIKGEEGATVKLTVMRGGNQLFFNIVRQNFEVQSVFSQMIGNIGYIKITEFNSNTDEQFNKALDSLTKQKAASFIFDVRDNHGGTIDSVAKIIDRLVPTGTIVSASYNSGKTETLFTSDAKYVANPMMVLVNGDSASAAELFACDLRDYGKAWLVGTKTYGKGTMQRLFQLSDGSAVNLTIAKFIPYKSANFDGVGLKPDYEIKLSDYQQSHFDMLKTSDDPQLQKAIQLLSDTQ